AQWERITLAVWGSRVRIPPAPPSSENEPRKSQLPRAYERDGCGPEGPYKRSEFASAPISLKRGGTAEVAFRPLADMVRRGAEGVLFARDQREAKKEASAMTVEKTRTERYDPATIEPKWQEEWKRSG